MSELDADLRAMVDRIYRTAPFVAEMGIELVEVARGRCVSELALGRRHQQQDGVVHAGVMATMADHTAGGAAATLAAPGEVVLGAGFTIHLLRPARGHLLRCVATVLKPGRRLSVVEAEVWCLAGEEQRLTAKATVSIATVPAEQVRGPD
jgi:uncharacterized protein (TIGR00369 family)